MLAWMITLLFAFSAIINVMGKAGQALKQALKCHDISQSRLAKALGVERPIVFRWFHGRTDPTADTVVQIAQALKSIDPSAATSFINLYLGEFITDNPLAVDSNRLLDSEKVNVTALSQIFDETDESYKYMLFLSLLDILEHRQFDVTSPISFSELTLEILTNAWIVYGYFKLSLGTPDRIADQLKSLLMENNQSFLEAFHLDKARLRSILQRTNYSRLIHYTSSKGIYQLVQPFFKEAIQGLKEKAVNQRIVHLASSKFREIKPLYVFNADHIDDCTAILIASEWADYLKQHFTIVRGWASWQWLQYMQVHNPTTLNLVNKLFIPPAKNPLNSQIKFWKSVMNHHSLRCVYSGEPLTAKNLALDHYLPWSFVAHDHLWNLTPIAPGIYESKVNHIPADQYFRQFVDLQHLALTTNHRHLSKTAWQKAIAPYVSDLNLGDEDLLDHTKLSNAYQTTFYSLKNLALRQGFRDGWVYER